MAAISDTTIIDTIIKLYTDHGDAQYGEDITQTEHAVQCARLAQREGADAQLISAALLHDIGHLLEEIDRNHGNFQHDRVGADFLVQHFGAAVSEPVRQHAQAKRYLCSVEPSYHDTLSAASRYSLKKQGGLMTPDEAEAFRRHPYFEAAVRLRRWDDHAKDDTLQSGDLAAFREVMLAAVRSESADSDHPH
jgi:gamma-butyrobetaine dioxygenase